MAPEEDLVFVVLDAVATLDLEEVYRCYRADGHGRAASGPEMMWRCCCMGTVVANGAGGRSAS